FGTHLRATITDNHVVTAFANSGPTNPAALRISPMVDAAADTPGNAELVVEGNRFSGPAKYGIMIHAGQPARGASYTGTVRALFTETVIDSPAATPPPITFTNVRATVLPWELNPLIPRGPACPTLPIPPVYWEYLTNTLYDLEHTG